MIVCPKCGKQLADGAKFCKFCGSATIQPQPQAIAQNNVQIPAQQKPKKKKSSKNIVLAIIAVILVIAIGVGGWLLWDVISKKKEEDLTDEEKLTQLLEESTTKPIIEFVYDDYDSDGTCEAYAVVGETDEEDEKHPEFYDADIYFVNHKKAQPIKENISGQVNGTIDVEDNKYISIEVYEDGTDEGKSFIYTADGTKSDEADISGKYSNVHEKDGRIVGFDENGNEVEMNGSLEDVTIDKADLSCDIMEQMRTANNGDIVEFGSYPQSLVTDSNVISLLESQNFNWVSYQYMDPETRNVEDDFMKFSDIDVDNDGVNDYRAVTFTKHRSRYAIDYDSNPVSYQDENGYYPDEIYYFRYEPLKWRVLDKDAGLIVSEELIDAQHYNKYLYWSGGRYYNETGYTNSWELSSIRSWLNDSFYNDCFNQNEKSFISISVIGNKSYDGAYDYSDTNDRIFLLSYEDMLNSTYGFTSENTVDQARAVNNYGTDYAKCQGLYGGRYFLRTAGFSSQSDSIVSVCQDGSIDYGRYSHSWDNYGIRPALKINV